MMIRRWGSTWDMLGSNLLKSEWVGLDRSRARGDVRSTESMAAKEGNGVVDQCVTV